MTEDKRKNNHRPHKYDEPKTVRIAAKLTPTGYAFFKQLGGWDWIEKQARNM
jgi:hypothetical protein